jgi:hypothetical protein
VAQDTRSPCSVAFGVMQHGNDLVRSQTPNPCINAAARVGLALSCRPLRKRRWKRMQVISFCDRSVGTGSGFKLINHTATSVRACRQPQPPGYHTMHGHRIGEERWRQFRGADAGVYSVSSCGLPSSLPAFFFVGPSFLLSLVPCVGLE